MSSPALAVARSTAADYAELTKPRITFMVVLTALVGFVLGARGGAWGMPLVSALLGTGFLAAGASTLNMVMERRTDALMLRTRNRPLPAGRLRPGDAILWGAALSVMGLALLLRLPGPAALVGLTTWATYLFFYTPLKPRTSLSTVVGAFPGALPPVIGWAAATGRVDGGAFVLFAILFLWQIPHFLAIAWLYRDDYARAGLPMLPVLDREGGLTGRQAVANSLALLVVSLAPAGAGLAGYGYLATAILLGLALTAFAVRLAVRRTMADARGLFLASVVYLTVLNIALVADRL